MASRTSITSLVRLGRGAVVATVVTLVVSGGVAHDSADACGWGGPSIEDLTMFDPDVLGDADGLAYNPSLPGFGGACEDCAHKAMLADWTGYLKEAVTPADWEKVLFEASAIDLAGISARLAGKTQTSPKGFEQSSLWKLPAARPKLQAAVSLIELARSIEPLASFEVDASANAKPGGPSLQLLAEAKLGFKSARDPFLIQRYAFAVLRVLFYQRDWAGAIAFFDKSTAALAMPSADLTWRAHYYAAGALRRNGNLARANLELSRVHANSPALATSAAEDFKPAEEKDWREALRQAKTVREKTELWRLVGLKKDAVVAIQEILKLDPKSNLVGLLMLRELSRAESEGIGMWGAAPEPKAIAAQKKAYVTIEQIAKRIVATPGADRPWVMQLVLGHLAAKRGDLATARTQLQAAVTARPGDVRVASQAKASLALALVLDWKVNPQREDELARSMNEIDAKFGRIAAVTGEVRGKLVKAYAQAGRMIDAQFLAVGAAGPYDEPNNRPVDPKLVGSWSNVGFLKDMIARTTKTSSEFDRFVLKGSYSKPVLEKELALRLLLEGDFAASAQNLFASKAASSTLGTDPFVTHIVDCHDCDHEKFANAKWTHVSFATRLAELQKVANGKGEPAAEAALALGTALYNVTWFGNARSVLEGTHQETRDTKAAERWYKRAYDLTKNRELKAKAAFYAAKAELGGLLGDPNAVGLPVPKRWFPVVKGFANTKYYKEILRECGSYQAWAATSK